MSIALLFPIVEAEFNKIVIIAPAANIDATVSNSLGISSKSFEVSDKKIQSFEPKQNKTIYREKSI